MLHYLIYCRKSSESEERQILSIESQVIELKRLAEKLHFSVSAVLTESRSAKAPGRPVFGQLLNMIKEGKAEGIICWKLDRLFRNFPDGALIIDMLQQGIIKHIQTADGSYYPDDNVLPMSVELGMANQYIRDLSKNVKRGLKTKVEKGWYPTLAPLGYLNDQSKEKGERTIIQDPERFELIKKMWEMMLTGRYTPPKIRDIANNQWGFRTPKGKPLARSTIYRLFTNPFYSGFFEYPKKSGNWYKGNHDPMITVAEYDQVQTYLGRRGNPRPKKYVFAFRGLLKCGECESTITIEDKAQLICTKCKHKFSTKSRDDCPKCQTPIEEMENPTRLHYVYYRCTKHKNPGCTQGSIEIKQLEKQIGEYFSKIQVSERFKEWALKHLKKENEKELSLKESILTSQRRAYANCLKKLDNLVQLKISPLNSDGSLLSDEEFGRQKLELVKEKSHLQEAVKNMPQRAKESLSLASDVFDLACHARHWFSQGTCEEKGEIIQRIGSNLTVQNRKLSLQLKKPLTMIEDVVSKVPHVRATFEPERFGLTETQLERIFSQNPMVRATVDEVRTFYQKNISHFQD